MADPREDIDALIVRTREAHEVLKDIKAATRELKDTIKEANAAQVQLMVALVDVIDEGIGEAVETGLANYHAAIDSAIVSATEAVYQRFDAIAAILLGEAGDMENTARMVRGTLEKGHVMTSQEQWQMEEMQKALDRRLGDDLDLRRSSLRPEQGLRPEGGTDQ